MSEPQRNLGKCAICGKPKDEKYKPFCSKRCSEVDLNRWFTGGYAIAAEEGSEGGSEEE